MQEIVYGNLICKSCSSLYPKCEIIEGIRKWAHRKFCKVCKANTGPLTCSRVSDELFLESIKSSLSIREAINKMGIRAAGGNYKSFHRRVERLNIDTSHFSGQSHMAGKILGPKRPLGEYLQNKFSISSNSLKRRILNEGLREHKCEECQLDWWLFDKIPLELHHKNGNSSDNQIENLQLLCPNCHALTDNYRGKNQSRQFNKSNKISPNPPIFRTKEDTILVKSKRASDTNKRTKEKHPPKTKINWPSNLELFYYIWENSITKFAETNGITGNAVARRCKRRNISLPPVGFYRKKQTENDVSKEMEIFKECEKRLVSPPEIESGYPCGDTEFFKNSCDTS